MSPFYLECGFFVPILIRMRDLFSHSIFQCGIYVPILFPMRDLFLHSNFPMRVFFQCGRPKIRAFLPCNFEAKAQKLAFTFKRLCALSQVMCNVLKDVQLSWLPFKGIAYLKAEGPNLGLFDLSIFQNFEPSVLRAF